jgi:hypothetical protein
VSLLFIYFVLHILLLLITWEFIVLYFAYHVVFMFIGRFVIVTYTSWPGIWTHDMHSLLALCMSPNTCFSQQGDGWDQFAPQEALVPPWKCFFIDMNKAASQLSSAFNWMFILSTQYLVCYFLLFLLLFAQTLKCNEMSSGDTVNWVQCCPLSCMHIWILVLMLCEIVCPVEFQLQIQITLLSAIMWSKWFYMCDEIDVNLWPK